MAKKIIIDPGHGGEDPGAVGYGLQEKNLNLDIALKLRNILANYADVQLTRNTDRFISLSERATFSNKMGADLFLSIHVNAGKGTGFESFVYTKASEKTHQLREVIHKEVASFYQSKGFVDRGMKKANFAVLRETIMPAVLIENLFIDRAEDVAQLREPLFRQEISEAITKGIVKALQIEGPIQPGPPPHWAREDFKRLQEEGLVFSDHNLDSNVTWGQFSAVIARLLDKSKLKKTSLPKNEK